jgi:hypothetical protein
VAGLVSASGFGVLLALWTFEKWAARLPGLFDYRSATIGDGLLLPVLVGCLVAGVARLPRAENENETRWIVTAAALGAIVGAATQAVWLGDDEPRANWTFPRPHHFNHVGWYHAAFLTLASSVLAGLTVAWALRMWRAGSSDDPERRAIAAQIARSPWLGVGVGAAATLGALIVLDNDPAAGTQAARASTLALAGGALLALAVVGWALAGVRREARRNILVGLVAAAGATITAADGLTGTTAIGVVSVASAALIGAAVTEPFRLPVFQRDDGPARPNNPSVRPFEIVAAALVLLGGLSFALATVEDNSGRAVLAMLIAPALAVWIGQPTKRTAASGLVAYASAVYGCGILVLAGWVVSGAPTSGEVQNVDSVALGFVDFLALTLVRRRFTELADFERDFGRSPAAAAGVKSQEAGPHAWIQVLGFAAPAILGLGVLIEASASRTGIDAYAGGGPVGRRALFVGLGLALVCVLIAAGASVVTRKAVEFKRGLTLKIPAAATALSVSGAVVFATFAVTGLPDKPHYPFLAAMAGLVSGALAAEDMARTGASIQLARLGHRGALVAASAAVISGVAVFWLLTSGLWSGSRPADVGHSLLAALESLGGAFILTAALSVVIDAGLRGPVLTSQGPLLNLLIAQAQYLMLLLIAAALPVAVVARVVEAGLKDPGLLVTSVLGGALGFGAFIYWITQNLRRHLHDQREGDPPDELVDAVRGSGKGPLDVLVASLNAQRLDRLAAHIRWQLWATGLVISGAALWVIVLVAWP